MSALPPLGAALAEHGLRAKKKFGQHFLLDPSINARIAAADAWQRARDLGNRKA